MKKILFLLLLGSTIVIADPYIEYKNEVEFKYDNYVKTLDHFRVGYKYMTPKGFIFIEAGKMTKGKSGEIGYSFKKNNWAFKGKWEVKNQFEPKSKLQTEIRYTFNK